MTKTQIQVPEDLFTEVKKFAQRRQWSLGKTFRRSAEIPLETYAEESPPASHAWPLAVTDFATANVKDFEETGFARVWNPVAV